MSAPSDHAPSDQAIFDFARNAVGSVWALELMLLLRRTAPKAWTPQALVGEMRASAAIVDASLARLETAGLLHRDDDLLTFAPASAALTTLCDALEEKYRTSPVLLINAIASPAKSGLQALADAFRLKGTDP
ncbi:MAG TPA: hypothetical protein VGL66_00855 [Caulobacteraceae bacterium]|jgi:hypothetical protein